MNELINGNAIKMTSIEIAELVGKRHDNVKRTIETLAKNGVIRLPQIEVSERINNLGFNVQYEHYVFEGEQGICKSNGCCFHHARISSFSKSDSSARYLIPGFGFSRFGSSALMPIHVV